MSDLLLEREMDPNFEGEDNLPAATIKRIAQAVFAKGFPDVKISVESDWDSTTIRADGFILQLAATAVMADEPGGMPTQGIFVNEARSGPYKGVVTAILGGIYHAMERRWGTTPNKILQPYEDRGHGAWQHIAQQLGVKYEVGHGGAY